MRCTKCHYLSFEPEPRCKNCGHDLSLEEGSAFNLAGVTLDSLEDSVGAGESGRTATAVLAPPRTTTSTASSRIPTADLPLFVQSMQGVPEPHVSRADDHDFEPLVKVPAKPRTPVSVRRTTPDPARLRAKYGMPPNPEPDLWSNIPAEPIDRVELHDESEVLRDLPLTPNSGSDQWADVPTPERLPEGWEQPVSPVARLGAMLIDVVLLGSISLAVVYLTLQVTGLSFSQIGLLPVLPITGLLVIIVGGYFLMFTSVHGQTIGTMAMDRNAHTRVVRQ